MFYFILFHSQSPWKFIVLIMMKPIVAFQHLSYLSFIWVFSAVFFFLNSSLIKMWKWKCLIEGQTDLHKSTARQETKEPERDTHRLRGRVIRRHHQSLVHTEMFPNFDPIWFLLLLAGSNRHALGFWKLTKQKVNSDDNIIQLICDDLMFFCLIRRHVHSE